MIFEVESFGVQGIGDLHDKRFAWVPFYISFNDPENGTHPSIEVRVAVQYQRSATIDEVRRTAFQKAAAVLSTANALFEKYGLEGLQQQEDARSEAHAREMEEMRTRVDTMWPDEGRST